jgi:hypothetical protein
VYRHYLIQSAGKTLKNGCFRRTRSSRTSIQKLRCQRRIIRQNSAITSLRLRVAQSFRALSRLMRFLCTALDVPF